MDPQTPPAQLALVLQSVPDTVVTVAARDGLGTAVAVSVVAMGVFFLLLIPLLLLLLLQTRKVERTVRKLGEEGLRKTDPLLERGKSIADNVDFISGALRTDVERLTGSVKSLAERLQESSRRMEERIVEFNALMDVVQSEAEGTFLDTAATVRGVRAGARVLGEAGSAEGPERDEEELRRIPPDGVDESGETYLTRAEGDRSPTSGRTRGS